MNSYKLRVQSYSYRMALHIDKMICKMLNYERNDKVSDTRGDDSSNAVD